jgi:hypothetical protein
VSRGVLPVLQVRQWNIWGLPKDDFSTENAIAIDAGVAHVAWQQLLYLFLHHLGSSACCCLQCVFVAVLMMHMCNCLNTPPLYQQCTCAS